MLVFLLSLAVFLLFFLNKGQCTAPRIDTSKHRNLVRLFDHDNFYLLRITVWSLAELKNCVVDVMMVCMGDSLRESKVRDVVDKIRLMWKKALKEVGALWVWAPQPPPPLPPSPRPKYALDPAFINVNHYIFNSMLIFLIVSPSACLGTRYNYSDETQWKLFFILRRQRTKRYSTIVLFRELSLFIYLFILFYFLMNVVNFFLPGKMQK